MHLAVGPIAAFTGFIQILLWIVAPILCLVVTVTVIMHYRRQRQEIEQDILQKLVASTPESSGYKIDDKEYVLFDHSGIIKEYKTQLVNNHAKYSALKQDFSRLEKKYQQLLSGESNSPISSSLNPEKMEHVHDFNGIQPGEPHSQDIEQQLDDLRIDYKQLLNEKEILLAKLSLAAAGDEEKLERSTKWKEENLLLHEKIRELDCFRELATEKDKQISFLQQQVDQRIRIYFEAESKLTETNKQLQFQQDESALRISGLMAELRLAREESAKWESVSIEKEEELRQKESSLSMGENKLAYYENQLRELREQNEILQASIEDNQEKINNLEILLGDAESRTSLLTQKLQLNKQLLRRLYNEFSACMDNESDQPAVVNLRPSFVNSTNPEE